jgi:hypothetical protein
VTKRDFITLADELLGLDVPTDVLGAIVRFCKDWNPRFLEARWRGYLAVEPSSPRSLRISSLIWEASLCILCADGVPKTPATEMRTEHAVVSVGGTS